MASRRHVITAIAGAAAILAASVAVATSLPRPDADEVRVVASSTSAGDPNALFQRGVADGQAWSSADETVGAWLEMTWPIPTTVDNVSIRGASESGFRAATLAFGDGSFLHLTADEQGDVVLDFRERTIQTARLTFAEVPGDAKSVGLASWSFADKPDEDQVPVTGDPTIRTSSDGDGARPEHLVDGDPSSGTTGAEWSADPAAGDAWVMFAWPSARELASVQVFGPSDTWTDPGYSAAAPLNGRLVFDDGSQVRVSGISGGGGEPTTIAFMPRMASTVRLELAKTIDPAQIRLRELTVHEAGETPSRWPAADDDGYTQTPPPSEACDAEADPFADAEGERLTLVCPSPGATVSEEAVVLVAAPARTSLVAHAFQPKEGGEGEVAAVATAVADDSGRAVLRFSTSALPHGPLPIRVSATTGNFSGELSLPLYVQLYNDGGRKLPGQAPLDGMTLQWEEEFRNPLSISHQGHGATYAATKPEYWGPAEFGEAVFADPAWGEQTVASLDDEYLRIRVKPLGGRVDPNGWNRDHMGGILSSLDVGASGFAAQYGYFEARMLGAGGRGAWPAFWMLNTDSATRGPTSGAEVDAVELYGHNTVNTCHAIHNWVDGEDRGGRVECLDPDDFEDWALAWHTYAVRITPGGSTFYVDGTEVATLRTLSHSSDPFYFMVNLALGGGWPVDISPTGNTVDLYVDYIRAYT